MIFIKKKFITNLKKVYKVDKYSILKVSKTNLITLNNNDLQSIVSKIHNSKCDLMVFSDFRHGIFNQKNINFINNKLNKKITRIEKIEKTANGTRKTVEEKTEII